MGGGEEESAEEIRKGDAGGMKNNEGIFFRDRYSTLQKLTPTMDCMRHLKTQDSDTQRLLLKSENVIRIDQPLYLQVSFGNTSLFHTKLKVLHSSVGGEKALIRSSIKLNQTPALVPNK